MIKLIGLILLIGNLFVSSQSQTVSLLNGLVNVTYSNNGVQTQFTVTSSLDSTININNAWVGFGFNSAQQMIGTNPVICQNNGGTKSVQQYYNTGYVTPSLLSSTNPTLGISSSSVVIGSNFVCSFTRDNTNPYSNYFNITSTNMPYFITAYGSISSNQIQMHAAQSAGYSSSKITLVAIQTTSTSSTTTRTTTKTSTTTTTTKTSTTTTTTRTTTATSTSTTKTTTTSTTTKTTTKTSTGTSTTTTRTTTAAPTTTRTTTSTSTSSTKTTTPTTVTTKLSTTLTPRMSTETSTVETTESQPKGSVATGSFSIPGYLIEWNNTDSYTDFRYTYNMSSSKKKRDIVLNGVSDIYIAFGLSLDNQMGNDTVCACRIYGGMGYVEHYWNIEGDSILLDSSNPSIGISNQQIINVDNQLICSFTRAKSLLGFTGQGQYYSLNNNYYLLISRGVPTSSGLQYHGLNRWASNSIIDFQTNSTTNENTNGINTIIQNIIQTISSFFSSVYSFFQNLFSKKNN